MKRITNRVNLRIKENRRTSGDQIDKEISHLSSRLTSQILGERIQIQKKMQDV